MTNRVRLLGLLAALAGTAAAGGATASATTAVVGAPRAQASSEAPVAPLLASAKPSGYLTVMSSAIAVLNGTQTFGSVDCPATSHGVARYPQGGGVLTGPNARGAEINGSYPSGTSWYGYVNNNSGINTTMKVYVICATTKASYTLVVNGSLTNPAGVQTGGDALCPTGTKVLGGGGLSASNDLTVNINSSYPVNNGWHVDMNNAGAVSTTFNVYAVCSKVSSKVTYAIVVGANADNPAFTQSSAFIGCPTGTVVLGGGGFSSSSSTAVNMNSSVNSSTGGWVVYEDNGTSGDAFIRPYVICAS